MKYYRDGKAILESRVIVGKMNVVHRVMYSRLSNVVVNPPWNAPTRFNQWRYFTEIKNDDPGYAACTQLLYLIAKVILSILLN